MKTPVLIYHFCYSSKIYFVWFVQFLFLYICAGHCWPWLWSWWTGEIILLVILLFLEYKKSWFPFRNIFVFLFQNFNFLLFYVSSRYVSSRVEIWQPCNAFCLCLCQVLCFLVNLRYIHAMASMSVEDSSSASLFLISFSCSGAIFLWLLTCMEKCFSINITWIQFRLHKQPTTLRILMFLILFI